MTAALGSPFDVSGAAHVPASVFHPHDGALAELGSPGQPKTLLRLEGITASAAHRARSLGTTLAAFGRCEIVEDAVSAALWRAIRDVTPFSASGMLGAWPVWRIVCPPAAGGAFGQASAT
jgi:glycolate oxidase FAD binding subunit